MLDVVPIAVLKKNSSSKEPLPRHPFLWSVVAPPRSGKSTLIANVIMNRRYGYKWDMIAIISPTAAHDETYKYVREKAGVVIYPTPADIDHIIPLLCESQEKDDCREKMLVIIDDCVGYMNGAVEKIASRYRHYNMSVLVASQQFRKLPPTVRTCSNYWCLYQTHNMKEVSKLDEEFSGQFPGFMKLYNKATKEKHSFLFLDISTDQAFQNFTDKLL